MGLGGPVWHVSTAWQRLFYTKSQLLTFAYQELVGVGDCDRGEWVEYGHSAVHIRRRLSAEEEPLVGPVIDIRRTPEAATRLWAVAKMVPRAYREMVLTADAEDQP